MAIINSVTRLGQFRLFAGLSEGELIQAGNWMEDRLARAGEVLYRQGEMPDFLYLVESGQIAEVGRDGKKQVILRRMAESGDLAGRRSALENAPHQATATVLQDAQLLAISTGNLRYLISTLPTLRDRLQRTDIVSRLIAMPLFSGFDRAQLDQIADLVRVVEYPAGQVIYRRNEMPSAMYVIKTGQVVETQDGLSSADTWARYRAAGSWVGQEELKSNSPYQTTALASTDVELFRINRDGLDWLQRLQPQFSQALNPPPIAGWLAKTELFAKLSDLEREHLAGFFGLAHYPPGEPIFRQGERDQTLYILYEGEAIVRTLDPEGKERPRDYVYPGAEYGERSAFLGEPHSVTAEAATANNWFYAHHDDLERYLTKHPEARDKLKFKPVVLTRKQLPRLKWMEQDEQLLLRERRHWAALVKRLFVPGVLIALLALFLFVLRGSDRAPLRALDVLGLAAVSIWLAWGLADWWNDYFIITTKRVAHREKLLFIRETRDEAPLDKVQNVNIEQHFWGDKLGFGSLVIDTAASFGSARVKFTYLSNPAKVQQSIFEEMSRVRAGERHEVRRAIRSKLAAGIGVTLQRDIPQLATASFSTNSASPMGGRPAAPALRLPRWQPIWTERKTKDRVTWRKHWIRLLGRVWLPGLSILSILIAAILLRFAGGVRLSPPVLGSLAVMLVLLGIWIWWGYENWGNDQYIVTNDRLIDIERLPLGLRTTRTETTFDKVQNVSYTIPNILANIFDYGKVIIHTAGTEGRLTFDWVTHPRQVQSEIFRRLGTYNENKRRQDVERRTADLPDWFASYDGLTRNRP